MQQSWVIIMTGLKAGYLLAYQYCNVLDLHIFLSWELYQTNNILSNETRVCATFILCGFASDLMFGQMSHQSTFIQVIPSIIHNTSSYQKLPVHVPISLAFISFMEQELKRWKLSTVADESVLLEGAIMFWLLVGHSAAPSCPAPRLHHTYTQISVPQFYCIVSISYHQDNPTK